MEGIFLTYDLSNRTTFDELDKKWKALLEVYEMLQKVPIVLLACKSDLTPAVDTTLIKFLKKYADDDLVVSSLKGENMKEALQTMVACILNRNEQLNKTKRGENPTIGAKIVSPSSSPLSKSLSTPTPSPNIHRKMSFSKKKSSRKLLIETRPDVGDFPHSFELYFFPKFTWCDFCDTVSAFFCR